MNKKDNVNNPFQIKKVSSKQVQSRNTVLLVVIIIVILSGVAAVHNYATDTQRIEQQFDYSEYFQQNNYPLGTMSLNQIDGQTAKSGVYGLEDSSYQVGSQIEPGLYQVEMIPLGIKDFYAQLIIEDQAANELYKIYQPIDSSKQIYNNIEFKDGEQVKVSGNSEIAYSINLIPQQQLIDFDQEAIMPGIYSSPQTIEPGSYKVENFRGYICDDDVYDQDNCDFVTYSDERFTIKAGQTLYIDDLD